MHNRAGEAIKTSALYVVYKVVNVITNKNATNL